MNIVKKNLVSILCGVVALLALVAIFWPISGMAADLQAKVDNSKKSYYEKIDGLRKANRRLPIVDPLNPSAEQQKLDRFPTQEVIQNGEKARDDVKKMSDEMKAIAVEKNRHTPLMPMSVTRPPDPFAFQRAYLQYLGLRDSDDPKATTIKTLLQSVTPPNDVEIRAEENRIYEADFKNRIVMVNGQPSNIADVEAQFKQMKDKLPERMRRERAEKYKIYLEPDAIELSPALGPEVTKGATADRIWFGQNMLWIDQDIAEAIARINKDSKNIMESPVKQLIKISVPDDEKQYLTLQSSGAAPAADAAVVLDDNMLAGKAYTASETGRICNPLYDVVHFMVEMNVDARKVPQIVAELQRGKLITVYTADTNVIDARAAVEDGYVYGDAPVINLRMQCEELFMRAWTVGTDPTKDALMPQAVEVYLGIVPDPNAAK